MSDLTRESSRFWEFLKLKENGFTFELAKIQDYHFDVDHGNAFWVSAEFEGRYFQGMAAHIDDPTLPIFTRLFIQEFLDCVGVNKLADLKGKLVYFIKHPRDGFNGSILGFAKPPFSSHEYDNYFCLINDWLAEKKDAVFALTQRGNLPEARE